MTDAPRRRGGWQLNVVVSLAQRGQLARLEEYHGLTRQEMVRKLIVDAVKEVDSDGTAHGTGAGRSAASNGRRPGPDTGGGGGSADPVSAVMDSGPPVDVATVAALRERDAKLTSAGLPTLDELMERGRQAKQPVAAPVVVDADPWMEIA